MDIKTNKNCPRCGCGLHPETGECSYCSTTKELEIELEHKLPDQHICPACNGKRKIEWYNWYLEQDEVDVCFMCNGTGWVDRELLDDIENAMRDD